jgi:hypothetical protein
MGHGDVFRSVKRALKVSVFRELAKTRPPPEPSTAVEHVTGHESTNRAGRLWAWPGYPGMLGLKQERSQFHSDESHLSVVSTVPRSEACMSACCRVLRKSVPEHQPFEEIPT